MTHITSIEHEGFYYVETSDGVFGKGCSRCVGTGHYSFNGMDSICYKCWNVWEYRLGDVFETRAQAEKWCHERAVRKAQADRKREAKRLAKLAARDAAWQSLKEAHPLVWDLVSKAANMVEGSEYAERDSFVADLASKIWSYDERQYTERQIAALQRVAERRVASAAEASEHPAPEGRVQVTGEIISCKVVEGDYGTSYKVLVKDDRGFKVWGSLPKAQVDQAFDEYSETHPEQYTWGPACWFLGAEGTDEQGVKGRRITFSATLTQSRDDVAFAFASRPTKGAWL